MRGVTEGLGEYDPQQTRPRLNGIGEAGSRAIAEMLAANVALTHLDISHNRVNQRARRPPHLACRPADPPPLRRRETPRAPSVRAGALALAEGIRANNALHQLELSHNPLCRASTESRKKRA